MASIRRSLVALSSFNLRSFAAAPPSGTRAVSVLTCAATRPVLLKQCRVSDHQAALFHTPKASAMAASTAATAANGAAPSSASIAVIVGSTRKPRAGPEVAEFVIDTLQTAATATTPPPLPAHLSFEIVDLAAWSLPLMDEPGIPSQVHETSGYVHEHTRKWSAEIARHAAFIFVTPQYNWGYPASLKNAIDFLFHEWTGKPAAIVSYGGRGGGKAADQLRQVLTGTRMRLADTMPALAFPKDAMMHTQKGELMGVVAPDSPWNEHRPAIIKAGQELAALLAEPPAS